MTNRKALKTSGVKVAVVDAISNDDLMRLGKALSDMPLVTAGSSVSIGLPQNFSLVAAAAAAPADAQQLQSQLGAGKAGQLIEHALANIARGLVDFGADDFLPGLFGCCHERKSVT